MYKKNRRSLRFFLYMPYQNTNFIADTYKQKIKFIRNYIVGILRRRLFAK